MIPARIPTIIPQLQRLGIDVEIAEASEITGRVEFRVTFPTERPEERRLVHVMRSSYNGRTIIKTHVVSRCSGMYKDYWEIGDQLSDLRSHDLEQSLTIALNYVSDNVPKAIAGQTRTLLGE